MISSTVRYPGKTSTSESERSVDCEMIPCRSDCCNYSPFSPNDIICQKSNLGASQNFFPFFPNPSSGSSWLQWQPCWLTEKEKVSGDFLSSLFLPKKRKGKAIKTIGRFESDDFYRRRNSSPWGSSGLGLGQATNQLLLKSWLLSKKRQWPSTPSRCLSSSIKSLGNRTFSLYTPKIVDLGRKPPSIIMRSTIT